MSQNDYRIEEKFGKTESGKKRLDYSICFQPCISPERYETLEFSFSNIHDLPTNIFLIYLLLKQYCCS